MKKAYIPAVLSFVLVFAATGCQRQSHRVFAKGYQCRASELSDPQLATDFVAVSRIHYNNNEMDCALAAAEEAVRLAPGSERAVSMRGFAYFGLEDNDSALADFHDAINLNADFPEAYDGRRQVYEKLSDLDKAIADLSMVVKLAESDREFHYLFVPGINERGNLYFQKGDCESALRDFTEAVKLEPDFYVWYKDRAKAYRRLGNAAAADADELQAARLKAMKNI